MSHNSGTPPSGFHKFFEAFIIKKEQENFGDIMHAVRDGVTFRGTNLWVLIFAILIASIGLNINSPVVVIGAMLISPLMGPIIGIGVGIAINDSALVKRAIHNITFAVAVSLIASTLYFLVSPIEDAHSELLARISPNVWDVLIAFFGGLAGIIAMVSLKKGNVIAGAAIATALMPPLCTAGYGIATMQPKFIFGALFLFFINAVFITVSTLVVARLLRFPYREFPDEHERARSRNIILAIVLVTLIPSVYFGYAQLRENHFIQMANAFIENEAQFPDDYLLKKSIDPLEKRIVLVYGGKIITEEQIEAIKRRLGMYDLHDVTLEIRQGFASLYDTNSANEKEIDNLTLLLAEHESKLAQLEAMEQNHLKRTASILKEMQILFPRVRSLVIESGTIHRDENTENVQFAIIETEVALPTDESDRLEEWLKTRTNNPDTLSIFRLTHGEITKAENQAETIETENTDSQADEWTESVTHE